MYMDFEYAGRRLSDFGCVICSISTSLKDYEIDIGCDITFTEVKNNHSSIHSKVSSGYENVYTATFDIIKYNCNSIDDVPMSSLEARNIIKWLNRDDYYKLKFINEIADESNVHYYGSFNVKQKMFHGEILGLTLTFTSNAPYGFSDIVQNKFMMLNTDQSWFLHGESDKYGLIYPVVTLRCFADGTYEITNKTTGTKMQIDNCIKNETIFIDGEHKIIDTDNKDHKKTLPNDFKYEYLDILVDEYESKNEYTTTLPCELIIDYMPVRKVGVI